MEIIKNAKKLFNYSTALNKFSKELSELQEKNEITVSDLDPNDYGDQRLKVEVVLRGKSVEEYFGIVDGLFRAHDQSTDKDERENIHNLTSLVMSIGESNKGIDWN